MESGDFFRSRPGGRDDAVTRRRNREAPRTPEEADGRRHRLPADQNSAVQNTTTFPSDILSTSDPLPLSCSNPERPTIRKAASEPPHSQPSDKTERPNESSAAGRPMGPNLHPEYDLADLTEEDQSYTTASDEPDWTPRHAPIIAAPEDSGDQADSEASDAEPQRRAWYCTLRTCRHLNPGNAPLCQICNASRLPAQPMDEAGDEAGVGPVRPAGRHRRNSGNMCLVCHRMPADHAFLHRRAACRAACGDCAHRLKRRRQPCPFCRRRFHEVITMLGV